MLGFGRVTCLVCGTRGRRADARRTQTAAPAFVCDACWAAWETAGRKCTACDTPVRGTQEVGVFRERKALGHADCGGARVRRA
jgi:hypothetical protein